MLLMGQFAAARQGYPFSDLHWIGLVALSFASLLASAGLVRQRKRAIATSIVLQALQVVAVALPGFTFQLAMGPVARVQLWSDAVRAQFGAYGSFAVGFEMLGAPPLMVNFVPLAVIAILVRALPRVALPDAAPDGAA